MVIYLVDSFIHLSNNQGQDLLAHSKIYPLPPNSYLPFMLSFLREIVKSNIPIMMNYNFFLW